MTDDREEGLETRRKRLGAELATVRKQEADERASDSRAGESRKGYAMAMKLSSEFIAAIVVGGVLGYLLDHFAGTTPWGMIVLLLLGFCAGVLNVLRSAGLVAKPRSFDGGMDKS